MIPTAVPSVYPASKANNIPNGQSIQLFCMTPTVIPNIFYPIVPTSIQSQVVLPSVKCGWFLCWCHLFEEYVSARVLNNLFEAHCVCAMNSVDSNDESHVQGSVFNLFVLFHSCLTYVCRC